MISPEITMNKTLLILLLCTVGARAESVLAETKLSGSKQAYAGESYAFLGDSALRLTIPIAPQPGHVLNFRWGAKNDQRSTEVQINGKMLPLKSGGYDGFRWLRMPVPAGVTSQTYTIELQPPAAGKAAFLAAVQLLTPEGTSAAPGTITVQKITAERPRAFPEMRALWDRTPSLPPPDAPQEKQFRQAEQNARHAAEAFYRSRKYIDGWLAHADPKTGLIPRNLRESHYWNGRDSAADNYPFMVLTAAMTDRPLLEGRLTEMLKTEIKLTCRVDRLPDDFDFAKQGWRREKVDLDAIIFDGAEYVKDGLLPITEWLGPSPWSVRMTGIIDDIWKHAPIATPFGKIPTLNFEVNGDLLQACSRLYWFTGDRKYLEWAIRLGDYYLLGDHHPTRDMPELQLGDHSCEVINGLSELYLACHFAAPEKKKAYAKPLHELYDRLLQIARNEHGLLYLRVNTRTGAHTDALTDNWGYNLDGLYTAFLLDGTTAYRDAVRHALANLKPHYTGKGGMCQSNTADGYADSIEGALTLLNREPVASAFEWVDTEIRTMWGKQQPDGVIEGWHGDGNSARTSLMYALWKTQGCHVEPWRADVRVGAVRDGDRLLISLAAEQPWSGKLIFDRPRHKEIMRLPLDYPRINQFPEWFTVRAAGRYTLAEPTGDERQVSGRELSDGVSLTLQPGVEKRLLVKPAAP
jgi:hypothetical protein